MRLGRSTGLAVVAVVVMALSGVAIGHAQEVLGEDGQPIVCPDGETLKIDFDAKIEEPTADEFFKARRELPEGKTLVFNEYTGELEVVDVVREERGGISMPADPLVYQCGPNNEPTLVHLSDVDPEAAAEARRDVREQLDDINRGGLLEGLGGDPAKNLPLPPQP